MNIVLSTTFSGTPDADDILAAQRLVRKENERRAALIPPGTPLDTSSAANLKASALVVLSALQNTSWQSYVEQARNEIERFTQAQLDQIKANLNSRLNAGESAASIVTDTAS